MRAGLWAAAREKRLIPAAAEAQQEGEWTIFWITLGLVIVSFVAVGGEFSAIKGVATENRG